MRKNGLLVSILSLLLMIVARPVFCAPLSHEFSQVFHSKNSRFIKIPRQESSLDEAIRQFSSGRHDLFANPSQNAPDYDYWLKLEVEVAEPGERYLINVYPSTDRMESYHEKSDGQIVRAAAGDTVPSSKRSVINRLPTVKLNLHKGTNTIYVKLRSSVIVRLHFRLLDSEQYYLKKSRDDIFASLSMGITIALLLYNMFLAISLRDRSYYYYCGFMVTANFVFVAHFGFFSQIAPGFPVLSNAAHTAAASLGLFCLIQFLVNFLDTKEHFPRITKLLLAIGFLHLTPLVMSFVSYRHAAITVLLMNFSGCVLALSVALWMCWKRHRLAFFYVGAWIPFLLMLAFRNAYIAGWYQPNFFGNLMFDYGLMTTSNFEAIVLALGLAERTRVSRARSEEKISRLNNQLLESNEKLEKAYSSLSARAELSLRNTRAILASLNEGVFTISRQHKKLIINPDFSKLMSDLFELDAVDDQDPIAEVFAKTDLNKEQLDNLRQVFLTSIGQSDLQWLCNLDHIPHKLSMDGKVYYVSCDIIVQDNLVEAILVTLFDATQQENMILQAKDDERTLDLLIAVSALERSDLIVFVNLLENSVRDIYTYVDSDNRAVLRILHSLKGIARLYAFKELTVQLHKLEDVLGEDKAMFLNGLYFFENSIRQIKALCHDKLKISFETVSILVEYEKLRQWNANLKNANTRLMSEKLSHLSRELDFLLGFSLEQVVETIQDEIKNTAEDIGVPKPNIVVAAQNDVLFAKKYRTILLSVLGQLMRNCVVHGVESPNKRRLAGKSEIGCIKLFSYFDETKEVFKLCIEDDGKGLDIKHFIGDLDPRSCDRQKLEKAVQRIFSIGKSTSAKVTLSSGRGVGLELVHSTLQRVNANIKIELIGEINEFGHISLRFVLELSPQMILTHNSENAVQNSA